MKKSIRDAKEAFLLYEKQNYQKAYSLFEEIYDQSVSENNESSYVLYYMSICQHNIDNFIESAHLAIRALEIDPYDVLIAKLNKDVFESIHDYIEKLIAINDKDKEIYTMYQLCLDNGHNTSNLQSLMIHFYLKRNMLKKAKRELKNATERYPNNKDLLKFKRDIAIKQKDSKTIEDIDNTLKYKNPNILKLSQ